MCLTCKINHLVVCADYLHDKDNMINHTTGARTADTKAESIRDHCQCGKNATQNIVVSGDIIIISYPIGFFLVVACANYQYRMGEILCIHRTAANYLCDYCDRSDYCELGRGICQCGMQATQYIVLDKGGIVVHTQTIE